MCVICRGWGLLLLEGLGSGVGWDEWWRSVLVCVLMLHATGCKGFTTATSYAKMPCSILSY